MPQLPPVSQRIVQRVLGGLVAVVVVAVVLGLAITQPDGTGDGGPTPVPNLTGMPLSRASTAATDAGFVLLGPYYVRRDDVPEGTVVEQEPPPGTVADPGTGIRPIVGTAQQLVIVPDVVGLTESDAILALTGLGFQVSRGPSVYDAEIPPGIIVATDPEAQTSAARGAIVVYTASLGPDPASDASRAPPDASASPTTSSPRATPTGMPPATATPAPPSSVPTATPVPASPTAGASDEPPEPSSPVGGDPTPTPAAP